MPPRSTRSTTDAPRLSLQAPRGATPVAEPCLLDGDHREGELYGRASFDGEELAGITLQECVLEGVSLDDTELRGARFIECAFEDLFAPVFRAPRSSWRETSLRSTRWVRPNSMTAGSTACTSTAADSTTSTSAAPG